MDLKYHLKKIYLNLKYRKIHIGKNSRFTNEVKFANEQNIFIGNNTYLNGGMIVAGKNSKIIIGNDCLISYDVHIRTTSHIYNDRNILIRNQGEIEKDIIIEDDVWIGYGAQIMSGVTIHKGAVIAAGAVVTKDVDEYKVVAGVPAKVIKERK